MHEKLCLLFVSSHPDQLLGEILILCASSMGSSSILPRVLPRVSRYCFPLRAVVSTVFGAFVHPRARMTTTVPLYLWSSDQTSSLAREHDVSCSFPSRPGAQIKVTTAPATSYHEPQDIRDSQDKKLWSVVRFHVEIGIQRAYSEGLNLELVDSPG